MMIYRQCQTQVVTVPYHNDLISALIYEIKVEYKSHKTFELQLCDLVDFDSFVIYSCDDPHETKSVACYVFNHLEADDSLPHDFSIESVEAKKVGSSYSIKISKDKL